MGEKTAKPIFRGASPEERLVAAPLSARLGEAQRVSGNPKDCC